MGDREPAPTGWQWRDVQGTMQTARRGIFIAIDNARDRLTQEQWALFISRTRYTVSSYCTMANATFLAEWHSLPDATGQSVCWLVEEAADPAHVRGLTDALAATAERFQPDGIGWSVAELETVQAVPAW